MPGSGRIVGMSLFLLLAGCGSTESDSAPVDGGAGSGGGGGAGGSGGSGGGGAAGGFGGVAGGGAVAGSGGSSASGGSSGSGGSAGTSGSGGVAGSAGGSGECALLAYCDCKARTDCKVESEACFCPCGVEPCEPNCSCACSGGKYLGCTPTSIFSPGTLEGIWLIGWAGGLNHFSWVRLEPGGAAEFFDGASIIGNAPRWCTGSGSWILTAKPNTVGLTLPSACAGFDVLTFELFKPPSAYPKGSILWAAVTTNPETMPLEAYKFGPNQCDAAMTSCTDPFL